MKLINKLCCIIGCLCLLFLVGCNPNNQSVDADNGLDASTKPYYEKQGYCHLAFDNCFKVEGDILYFNDDTSMVKQKSSISISFNKDGFKQSGNYFVNYQTSKILTDIKINDTVYSLDEFDMDNFTVKHATTIKPVITSFSIFGVAIVTMDSSITESQDVFTSHDESLLRNKNLQYVVAKNDKFLEDALSGNLDSSIEFEIKIENTDEITLTFEFDEESIEFGYVVILKTEDDKLYLANLDSVNGKFCIDQQSGLKVNVESAKSLR